MNECFLCVCFDAENDGKPQSLDVALLSTGVSVIEIIETLYTLHPCSYTEENYSILLHYSTIINHWITLHRLTDLVGQKLHFIMRDRRGKKKKTKTIKASFVMIPVLYIFSVHKFYEKNKTELILKIVRNKHYFPCYLWPILKVKIFTRSKHAWGKVQQRLEKPECRKRWKTENRTVLVLVTSWDLWIKILQFSPFPPLSLTS